MKGFRIRGVPGGLVGVRFNHQTAHSHSRAIKRERKKERKTTVCYCRRKAFNRESLTEERIERLFSSLALLLRRRLRKTLIQHEYCDGKDAAKEKQDEEGKTPSTTTRRRGTEDDKEDKEDKKEDEKRFRKRRGVESFKSSRGKDYPRRRQKQLFCAL